MTTGDGKGENQQGREYGESPYADRTAQVESGLDDMLLNTAQEYFVEGDVTQALAHLRLLLHYRPKHVQARSLYRAYYDYQLATNRHLYKADP